MASLSACTARWLATGEINDRVSSAAALSIPASVCLSVCVCTQ